MQYSNSNRKSHDFTILETNLATLETYSEKTVKKRSRRCWLSKSSKTITYYTINKLNIFALPDSYRIRKTVKSLTTLYNTEKITTELAFQVPSMEQNILVFYAQKPNTTVVYFQHQYAYQPITSKKSWIQLLPIEVWRNSTRNK